MTANCHANGPETEYEAFAKIKPAQKQLQEMVYNAIEGTKQTGMTGDEAIVATKLLDYTCRPRITELHRMGLVKHVGHRENKRGNRERVYASQFPGLDYHGAVHAKMNQLQIQIAAARVVPNPTDMFCATPVSRVMG